MIRKTASEWRAKRWLDRVCWMWIVTAPLVVAAGGGFASPDAPQAREPDSAGSGMLLRKSPEGLEPLPLLDVAVDIRVTGIIVRGTLDQSFRNPTADVIEAVYVFPLPERAAVDRMEMRIGARRIRSVIEEREEAKATYAKARKEGRKAALTEQERPNLFTTSVANINPGETVEVHLEYLEELEWSDGEFGLVFPLTFTPRFARAATTATGEPAGEAVAVANDGRNHDAGRVFPPFTPAGSPSAARAIVQVRLRLETEIDEVVSPSHRIRTRWEGDELVVEPEDGAVPMDRDFVLRWRPLVEREPASAAHVEPRDDGRYVLMMLLPPREDAGADPGLPTETVFVLDVSGSMAGPSIRAAVPALIAALRRLRPDDRFDVLAFDDALYSFREGLVPAGAREIEDAVNWVGGLEARGGTLIHPAVVQGLQLLKAHPTERVQRIILLTDGAVANESEVIETAVGELGAVRLHTLGIGPAPNRYFMRRMAAAGHGLCEFISGTSATAGRMERFLERLERPVATDLELRWEGVTPEEVYPARLPDLHDGEPLVISARLPAGSTPARVVLTGRLREHDLRQTLDLGADAPEGSGVATRWARAKVGSLMDSLQAGGEPAQVRKAVVAVATAFGLVTRYTSLVAVEEFPSATGDARTVPVASVLPAGSRLLGALPQGGTLRPLAVLLGMVLVLGGAAMWLAARPAWRAPR